MKTKSQVALDISKLDKLTVKATAFKSYAQLAVRLLEGYVPTLRPNNVHSRSLAVELIKLKYKVFNPVTGRNWVDENG